MVFTNDSPLVALDNLNMKKMKPKKCIMGGLEISGAVPEIIIIFLCQKQIWAWTSDIYNLLLEALLAFPNIIKVGVNPEIFKNKRVP